MSENTNTQMVRVEDLVPVRSRVCWGAVIAGAVIALAVYMVLTLLGGAIGLSLRETARNETLSTVAAIYAIFTSIVSLFLGGWVTTQLTVGENKSEAIVHGIIMWGVVLALILWLVSTGVRAGFNAMVGTAAFSDAARNLSQDNWEEGAQRVGVSRQTIEQWKQQAKDARADAQTRLDDPATRETAAAYTTQVTWWTLLGTLLSMGAAIGGALVGSGPSFRLVRKKIGSTRATSEVSNTTSPVGAR